MNNKGQLLSAIIIMIIILIVIASFSLQSTNLQNMNELNQITETDTVAYFIASDVSFQHENLNMINATSAAIQTFNNEFVYFLENYYPTYNYSNNIVSGNGISIATK